MNVDFYLALSPIAIAAWAFFRGSQLYKHAVRRETLFQERTGEVTHLRYLREVSLATCALAVIYFFAKLRDVSMGHFKGVPEVDLAMWAAVDGAVFAVLALLCLHGRSIADAVVKFGEVDRKNGVLHAMIEAAGGFVWVKDAEGRYVFCDNTFCSFFFAMGKMESVVGFNDMDLIAAFKVRTKMRHTYGEMCVNTDAHCKEQKRKCRYIECGHIGDTLVILDVIKTPLLNDDGAYTGVVGMAWDRAQDCEHVFKDLEQFKQEGRIVQLAEGVYWVKDAVQECRWERPFPTYYEED